MKTAALIMIACVLAGCATMTPEEKRVVKYVAIGIAVGGVAAIAASKKSEDQNQNRGTCVIYTQGGC